VFEWKVAVDDNERAARDSCKLGKRRDTEMVIEGVVRILRAEPPLSREENSRAVRRRARNAEGRTSGRTAFAGAATRDEDEDDVIT
jgi:hypothetical protein